MTNIQAALGLAQLEILENSVKKRREIGNIYNELFSDLNSFQLPVKSTSYAENIYWVYGVLITKPKLSVKKIVKKLKKFVNELKKLSPLIEIATSTANSTEEAKSLVLEALQSPKKIDTIFCMSDEILTGVIMAINQLHLSMPDEIAGIGRAHV